MGGSSLAPWVRMVAVAFLQRLVLVRAQHLVVAFRDLMTGAKEQTLHALGPGVMMGVDDEGELAQ